MILCYFHARNICVCVFYMVYMTVYADLCGTRRYDFNDSMVSSTTPEKAVAGSAYVLFYKRRYVVSVCV